jgi:GT2 family glycosyltransferase
MISAIMAAYNVNDFIAPAIESILNQTYPEFELIIIDDGSTDTTLETIKLYVKKDHRIRLIQSEHLGAPSARNLGINEAKYSWIAIMDADDVALPERFERQIEATKTNPKVVVWGTYAHHISSTGEIISVVRQGVVNKEDFYESWHGGHIPFVINPTALLKKNVLLAAGGYDPKYQFVEDLDLFARMANYGPILAIPEPLLLYRIHSKSESMQKFFKQKQLARYIVARHRSHISGEKEPDLDQFTLDYQQQPLLPKIERQVRTLGQFWYRSAGLYFAEKNYLQAGWYLLIAIASNPSYSIPRVWKQKLSPKTRQSLGLSKKV